jgi:hypothetical protein
LNDLVERLDRTLDRQDQSLRGLRAELRALRRDLRVATVVIIAVTVGTGVVT